jgi:hypothetical protein
VGRRDRGCVEVGECVPQPLAADGDLLVADPGERGAQTTHPAGSLGVAQGALGLDELLPDPFAQLLARGPAEGDHQHLVEGGVPLRDVAGDERAHGVRLAGAGTRLEQGRPAGQLAVEVERGHRALSRTGVQSRQASAPRRVV